MYANCLTQSLAKATSYRTIKLLSAHLEWELSHSLFPLKISSPGQTVQDRRPKRLLGEGSWVRVCGWVGGGWGS